MARSSIEDHPQDAQKYTNLPTRLSCHQSRVHELEQLLLHHQLRVRELEHLLLRQESRVCEVEGLLYEQELDHSRRAQEVKKSGIEAEYSHDRYCISYSLYMSLCVFVSVYARMLFVYITHTHACIHMHKHARIHSCKSVHTSTLDPLPHMPCRLRVLQCAAVCCSVLQCVAVCVAHNCVELAHELTCRMEDLSRLCDMTHPYVCHDLLVFR